MNKNDLRKKMEGLMALSVEQLYNIINNSDDDKTVVAAISQARALLKDSAVDVVISEDEEAVKNLSKIVNMKDLPFEVNG